MWELTPRIQHYDWGDTDALPRFLGQEPTGVPWAEAWYGAHAAAPSLLADGSGLDELIAARTHAVLGEDVARMLTGRLPYLLKVIAAAKPLSLQVHPSRAHAAESFAAESAAGLPLEHPDRTYRDDNHKPEMLLALEEFQALCGFRTPRRALQILEGLDTALTDRLHGLLRADPTAHGMRAAFRTLVSTSLCPNADEVAEVVCACAARAARGASPSPRIDRAVALLQKHFPGDPGVVTALLLNPVTLQAGEAMYVPAGVIHSYLSGMGVEIMASSDNVLRAGLTPKRVDAAEVLQCVSMVAAPPTRVAPESLTEHTVAYYAPVDDFELTVTTVMDPPGTARPSCRIPGSGPRILLTLDGEALVQTGTGQRTLCSGEAMLVPACAGAVLVSGRGRIIQASVP